jgi:hypothetical protein
MLAAYAGAKPMPRPLQSLHATVAAGLVALLLSSSLAVAHGIDKPKHGGTIQMMGEFALELVQRPEGVEVYLVDDGEAVGTGGLAAKLVIAQGGKTTEAALTPGGGNRLVAAGVTLPRGARVTVVVTSADNASRWTANFAIP